MGGLVFCSFLLNILNEHFYDLDNNSNYKNYNTNYKDYNTNYKNYNTNYNDYNIILNKKIDKYIDIFDKIIFIGSPINGTMSALKSILGLGNEMFVSSDQIKILSNDNFIKSISEMLPDNNRLIIYRNNEKINLINNLDLFSNINKENINEGILFRRELNKISIFKNLLNFISINGLIESEFTNFLILTENNKIEENKIKYGSDGTVSIEDTISPFISKYYYVKGSHISLAENKDVLKILDKEITSNILENNYDISSKLIYPIYNELNLKINILSISKYKNNIKIKFQLYFTNLDIEISDLKYSKIFFYGSLLQEITTINYKNIIKTEIFNELEYLKFGFIIFENLTCYDKNKILYFKKKIMLYIPIIKLL